MGPFSFFLEDNFFPNIIYIYMAVGATGAAFLAHFFIFPQFYSEKSRFRDVANLPLSVFFFGGQFDKNWLISAEISLFLLGAPRLCRTEPFLPFLIGECWVHNELTPTKFNIPRVSVASQLKCDRNPGNVKLSGVYPLIMSTGSDKV